jgi:DNA-binding transcriptional regulator YdaS (Cro superfamily)
MVMNLTTYLNARGDVNVLAGKLCLTPVLVSQWKTGVRAVPAERCPDIEAATNGAVTCEELRPDVNWAVLRKAPKQKVAA